MAEIVAVELPAGGHAAVEVDSRGVKTGTVHVSRKKLARIHKKEMRDRTHTDPGVFRMVYGEVQLRANKTSTSDFNADKLLAAWGSPDGDVFYLPEVLVAGVLLAGGCYSGTILDCPKVGSEMRTLAKKEGQPILEQTFQVSDYEFGAGGSTDDKRKKLAEDWTTNILDGNGGNGVANMQPPATFRDGRLSESPLSAVPDFFLGFLSASMTKASFEDVRASTESTPPLFASLAYCKTDPEYESFLNFPTYLDPCGPKLSPDGYCELAKIELGESWNKNNIPTGKKMVVFAPPGSLGRSLTNKYSTCGDYVDVVDVTESAADKVTTAEPDKLFKNPTDALEKIKNAAIARLYYTNYQQGILPFMASESAPNLEVVDLSSICNTTYLDGVKLGTNVQVVCEVHEGPAYGQSPGLAEKLLSVDSQMKKIHEGYKNQTWEIMGYTKKWGYLDMEMAGYAYQFAARVLLAVQDHDGTTVGEKYTSDREEWADPSKTPIFDSVFIDAQHYMNGKVTKLVNVACWQAESCDTQDVDEAVVNPLIDAEAEDED